MHKLRLNSKDDAESRLLQSLINVRSERVIRQHWRSDSSALRIWSALCGTGWHRLFHLNLLWVWFATIKFKATGKIVKGDGNGELEDISPHFSIYRHYSYILWNKDRTILNICNGDAILRSFYILIAEYILIIIFGAVNIDKMRQIAFKFFKCFLGWQPRTLAAGLRR